MPASATTPNCRSSAPAIKNMMEATSTSRMAVLILGWATSKTVINPMSTAKGIKPTCTSRMRSPLLASHALT